MKTILVVEGNAEIGAFLVAAISEETPHQAILVTDGFLALETIKEFIPDLVFLDYYLPRMNGIALYDRLHANKGMRNIPAILMSTNLAKQEYELTKRNITGLCKPIDLDQLLQKLHELLPE